MIVFNKTELLGSSLVFAVIAFWLDWIAIQPMPNKTTGKQVWRVFLLLLSMAFAAACVAVAIKFFNLPQPGLTPIKH
jgi:hypothetical protein